MEKVRVESYALGTWIPLSWLGVKSHCVGGGGKIVNTQYYRASEQGRETTPQKRGATAVMNECAICDPYLSHHVICQVEGSRMIRTGSRVIGRKGYEPTGTC